MIKIVATGDTHLGFDLPVKNKSNKPRQGEDFFANFRHISDFAINEKADILFHGGDLFYRTKVPQPIIHRVYDMLLEFAESGIPLIIVPGNHESSKLPESLLTQHKNIYIFDKPKTYYFEIKGCKLAFSGFPYLRGNIRDNIASTFESIHPREDHDISFLCMHHAIEGATVGPGNFTFSKSEDTIQMRDIPENYSAVLSGHIHRRQILWKNKKLPIVYPGSVERTSFAEQDETKGFYLLELQEQSSWHIHKITAKKLPARPMYKFELNQQYDSQNDLLTWINDIISDLEPNAIVKIKPENFDMLLGTNLNTIRDICPDNMIIEISGFNKFFKKRSKKE